MLPHTQPPATSDSAPAARPSGSDGGDAPRRLRREDFEAARGRIAPHLHRTPLLSFRTLGDWTGGPALLKCENLQKTGSFKVRGALNAVACLSRAERARGVTTVSAGNHAQAVAWAARRHGTRAVVVMPEAASRTKIAAATGYGAEVALHGSAADAFREARRRAESEGLVFLHPFDCEHVVEGHGTPTSRASSSRTTSPKPFASRRMWRSCAGDGSWPKSRPASCARGPTGTRPS